MPRRKIIYSLMFILLVISLVLSGIIFFSRSPSIKIIFFNIGQGDAILISQGSNQILIDGGSDSQIELEKLGEYIPFWDREIEVIMATHPDQDHIGGIIGVMKNYQIGQIIDNSVESDSQVYKAYLDTIDEKRISRIRGEKGLSIKLAEANIEILYPAGNAATASKDTNAESLVAKLVYGKNSFLFTGDFPSEKDAEIFSSGADLSAKILKVAHHGSKYSTSGAFLEKANPDEAVISVGAKNRYGHPSAEVIDRLREHKIEILRTDTLGDIVYNCQNLSEKCFLETR